MDNFRVGHDRHGNVAPENLRANVYMTPHILTEVPGAHQFLTETVQSFLEAIGVPSAERYERTLSIAGYSFATEETVNVPQAGRNANLLPDPVGPGHARYQIHGRPFNTFRQTNRALPPPVAEVPDVVHVDVQRCVDEAIDLIREQRDIEVQKLQTTLRRTRCKLVDARAEVAKLEKELQDTQKQLQGMRNESQQIQAKAAEKETRLEHFEREFSRLSCILNDVRVDQDPDRDDVFTEQGPEPTTPHKATPLHLQSTTPASVAKGNASRRNRGLATSSSRMTESVSSYKPTPVSSQTSKRIVLDLDDGSDGTEEVEVEVFGEETQAFIRQHGLSLDLH